MLPENAPNRIPTAFWAAPKLLRSECVVNGVMPEGWSVFQAWKSLGSHAFLNLPFRKRSAERAADCLSSQLWLRFVAQRISQAGRWNSPHRRDIAFPAKVDTCSRQTECFGLHSHTLDVKLLSGFCANVIQSPRLFD